MRLSELHRCIQAAMGWQDYHLHEFRIGPHVYGIRDDEWYNPKHVIVDDSRDSLRTVAPHARAAFTYEYDFGDSWQLLILMELITSCTDTSFRPVRVGGERACPLEDVGGPWGYQELLEAIVDQLHEEHEAMLTWVGGRFGPDDFDLDQANRRLQRLR
jgi:hypothetical protein